MSESGMFPVYPNPLGKSSLRDKRGKREKIAFDAPFVRG